MNDFKVKCPACGRVVRIPGKLEGKAVKCPCGGNLRTKSAQTAVALAQEKPEASTKNRQQTQDTANPNLIDCPDCYRRVSKKARACPGCGSPLTNPEQGSSSLFDDQDFADLGSLPPLGQPFTQQPFTQQQTKQGNQGEQNESSGEKKKLPMLAWVLIFCCTGPVGILIVALYLGAARLSRLALPGFLLAVAVVTLLCLAFFYDTSVSSGSGRVHNIGLMQQKQNFMILGGIFFVASGVWLGFEVWRKQQERVT